MVRVTLNKIKSQFMYFGKKFNLKEIVNDWSVSEVQERKSPLYDTRSSLYDI